jgi:hypothetical protein
MPIKKYVIYTPSSGVGIRSIRTEKIMYLIRAVHATTGKCFDQSCDNCVFSEGSCIDASIIAAFTPLSSYKVGAKVKSMRGCSAWRRMNSEMREMTGEIILVGSENYMYRKYRVRWDDGRIRSYVFNELYIIGSSKNIILKEDKSIKYRFGTKEFEKSMMREKYKCLHQLRTVDMTQALDAGFLYANSIKNYYKTMIRNLRLELKESLSPPRKTIIAERNIYGHTIRVEKFFKKNKTKLRSIKNTLRFELNAKVNEYRQEMRKATTNHQQFGITFNKLGTVRAEPNTIIAMFQNGRINVLRESKIPLTDENHIGIEIEFASRFPTEEVHV